MKKYILFLLFLSGCASNQNYKHNSDAFMHGCLNGLIVEQSRSYAPGTPMLSRFSNWQTCKNLEQWYLKTLKDMKEKESGTIEVPQGR